MHEASFEEKVEVIRAQDSRYAAEAYSFLREALDYTQKTIAKDSRGRLRHVTGQELLGGIREFALAQFGPMTMMVLEEWGIHHCRDFGELVFNMVESDLLAKTDRDSRADFGGGYDFFDAFRKPFLPPSQQVKPEPTPAPAAGE
jgi:uncharacterized repeat protein (TIGR04138 family)